MAKPMGISRPRTAGLLATCAVAALGTSVQAQTVPIDLNTWTQEGAPSNGNWNVAADGSSVLQTINGNPTFFVSPNNYLNTNVRGEIAVETTGDDDFIGFVFGYQSPLNANGDAVDDMEYFLFDWKQLTQTFGGTTAQEGFNLTKVDGTITDINANFWNHQDSAEFDVLDTDYGDTRGWEDGVVYEFDLLYTENRIRIDIMGGDGDFETGQTIFDLDAGSESFAAGRFGFYNYSQAQVRYIGFTEQAVDPDEPDGVIVPLPAGAWMGMSLFAALGGVSLIRRRLHSQLQV